MLIKIFLGLSSISPYLKKLLWRRWYQFLASHYQNEEWSFMNYGYTPIDDQRETLRFNEADEPDRYAIQLYHHVISAVDLTNLDVLEIGSGRGGGASYVARYLKPKRLTGLDFSDRAIEFCKRTHAVDGLSFIKGDAEALPFDAERFDAVINVESSHCYGSMEAFLANVKRVLRQNGYFLYADFRNINDVALLHSLMEQSGMKILKREDITANVLRSLDLDDQRKLILIRALFRGLATEAISRICRRERIEDPFGLPNWHDDLFALCSAEITGRQKNEKPWHITPPKSCSLIITN